MQLLNRANPMRPEVLAAFVSLMLVLLLASAAPAQTTQPAPGQIRDGVLWVDGKPYFKTAAFFGYNHWMTRVEAKSLGNFLTLPQERLGTATDFYTDAGFNTGFYSAWANHWFVADKPFDPTYLREAIRRAEKVGQKITLHIPMVAPASVLDKHDAHWINDKGEKVPFSKILGIHHDPKFQAMLMRETYQSLFDAIRDSNTIIDIQIGSERWPYDYVRMSGSDVSYDEYSLNAFRNYLKKRFTLEQISQRYGKDLSFYKTWEEVFPPVPSRPLDYAKRKLGNYDAARWDWYGFRKAQTVEVWLEMLKTFEEMDGRGRPFYHEYGHGPFYSMGFGPFQEICARNKNFTVGNGDFLLDIAGTLCSISQVKACGPGPWINNELDSGTAGKYVNAAEQRRKIWSTIALGSGGYNLWTFFNLLGAESEFMDDAWYDPQIPENLPLKYFEVRQSNRMIRSLGDLLAGSKAPPMPLGLLLLDDAMFMYSFSGSYYPEGANIARAATAHGVADQFCAYTEYHLDNDLLTPDKVPFLVLPRTPRITDARAKRLADFVEQGGTLVLMGPTAKVDELFKTYPTYPYGPLATVAGVQVRDLTSEEVRVAPTTATWNDKNVHVDVISRLTLPPGSRAKVLARDARGEPALSVNEFGKGRCYVFSGYPYLLDDHDATGALLAEIFASGGVRPAAKVRVGPQSDGPVDTGIFASRRVGPHGTLLFLVETADQAHQVNVTLDPSVLGLTSGKTYSVFECFSNEKHRVSADTGWTFPTAIEPVGVRVFLISEAESLDGILPKSQRFMVPRAADQLVTASGPLGKPVRAQAVIEEQRGFVKSVTTSAGDVHPATPTDLGQGYLGLDLNSYSNESLATLVKDVDYAEFVNFGAEEKQQDSRLALPIRAGRNAIGDVPVSSGGRFARVDRGALLGIPVGRKIASLHFFHGGQFGQHGSVFGHYRVRYADGSTQLVPIALGVTMSDFTRPARFPAKTVSIWNGKGQSGPRVTLSRYDWQNPWPEKEVIAVDIVPVTRIDPRPFSVWGITARVP